MHIVDSTQTQILLENRCELNGSVNQMWLNIDLNNFADRFIRWQNGEMIQHAFDILSADEREFIMTGITPELWDSIFGEEE